MPRNEPNAAHSLLNGQLDSKASDASSAFYANFTRSASVLQFFVSLMPESYNLVIKACANDTVQSLHEKIQSFTGIPVIEQRLMYRGKQLQWEQSLAECSIENDAGLRLLACLRSTKLPQHWQVIGDLLSTVCRLCKGKLHPSAFKVIRTLMSDYFEKISKCRKIFLSLTGWQRSCQEIWFQVWGWEVLDFECRRHLAMMMFPEAKEDYEMLIDRSQLLAESFEHIAHADPESLHGGLFMEFKNEEATGPGVLQKWFFLVCQAIFSPINTLFVACPNDPKRFFPNNASKVDPLHLKYFSFSGRVVALALMHRVQIGSL